MNKEQKIAYEPHPVSVERKAELRGQGYTIIDAVYAPASYLREDGPTVTEFVEADYLAANYPPEGYASRSTAEEVAAAIAAYEAAREADAKAADKEQRKQLIAVLKEKGIEFNPKAPTEDLLALSVIPAAGA